MQSAVEQWVAQYGLAIGHALSGASASPDAGTAPQVGGFLVHPGITITWGESPAVLNDFHTPPMKHLEPLLQELFAQEPGTELHALTLTLVLGRPSGDGECRVDGVVSPKLCERALAFSWPPTTTPYMLKQYYVLAVQEVPGGPRHEP